MHNPVRNGIVRWLLLSLPLVAIGLWMATLGVGYGGGRLVEGWVAALAFAGFLTLLARWRLLGPVGWLVAWLLYLAGFVITMLEAVAWYFQGSGFSIRFFANVRLSNLKSGLHAFPGQAAAVVVVLLIVLVGTAWLLYHASRDTARTWHPGAKAAALVALAIVAVVAPSSWQRIGRFVTTYHDAQPARIGNLTAADLRLLANSDPVPRNAVRASAGKNLVIVYMESLERIYTDNKIFPGLTPHLNYWRKRGLDYAGYLTYTGADYTMAGLFASQCGAPYLPSPERALSLGGNDANAVAFQPHLACLGDVLRAAGYTNVFMQGVNLKFADEGTFFRMHGFERQDIWGLTQFEKAHGGKLPHPGWGLYDSYLFRYAVAEYKKLAAAGKPFNLDVLTIDNHPPTGRPSPGCPKYTANHNSTLQSVHCTDYLVGKFLDAIRTNPAFKNTVVVVMSDHQSMRNSAWPLYPKWYKRRPLLFIINAGQGRRDMRFYHMDIAPTVLHLMGVHTNATFLAGADRSAANAPNSPLVNDAADVAVLRDALWSRAQPLVLCKGGVLLGKADNGVRIGGYAVPWSWRGRRQVGLRSSGAWLVEVGKHNVHGTVVNDFKPLAWSTGAGARPSGFSTNLDFGSGERAAHEALAVGDSVLAVHPIGDGSAPLRQFSINWISPRGGVTHLGEVPRLYGLKVSSPKCTSLLQRMDALPAGRKLDLSASFRKTTAPLYPRLDVRQGISFVSLQSEPFEREVGWLAPQVFGSWGLGSYATLGFTLPRAHCHAMEMDFKVHPYIVASRPKLDVGVYANGALMTTWHFGKQDTGKTWHHVFATVRTPDAECRVDLRFVFNRPGASPPPYPKGEDPRPLQLLFLQMQPAAAGTAVAAAVR